MKSRAQLAKMEAIDRRQFLKRTASLTLAIGAGGLIGACDLSDHAATNSAAHASNALHPNIWVTIHADNAINIMFASTEMGQGAMTATPLILAEHMDADWDDVTVETVSVHDSAYGNPVFANYVHTAGSTSVPLYFDKMRIAGTQARKMLLLAAAVFWDVPLEELTTELSTIKHEESGRSMTYGDAVQMDTIPTKPPEVNETEFKSRDDYRYLGKAIDRIDIPRKVNGTIEYGIDVQVPGMSYAAVLRAPVEGERPITVDDKESREVNGITDIVHLSHGVAVVGDTVEATKSAKDKLKVIWSRTSAFRRANSDSHLDHCRAMAKDLSVAGTTWAKLGSVSDVLDTATDVVEALYTTEPVYHGQMEPLNATASVSADGKSAEIWVGTQAQSLTILGAAQALDTVPENITLHPLLMGGSYGRRVRLRQQYVDDALFVSRAISAPVKVIWSREDDLEMGHFRPATAQFMRAAFDSDGKLSAVHHRVAAPTILETMNPIRWAAAGGKDVITMLGSENADYDIPNHLAEHVFVDRGSRVVSWRGVGGGYTKFAAESFIDELAAHRRIDPLKFRLNLCHNNPRMQTVLKSVADMADWPRARHGSALGIALAGYYVSPSACVVEVSANRKLGKIEVHKIWGVADAGFVVSPVNSEAQFEGNIVMGLSAALKERITIINGRVQQTNFHDYPILRMAELPEIHTTVLSTENPSSGVGELGLAMIGPAIANAIAKLTGVRLRQLPFATNELVRAL